MLIEIVEIKKETSNLFGYKELILECKEQKDLLTPVIHGLLKGG